MLPAPPPLLTSLINASAGRGRKDQGILLGASSPLKSYAWEVQFTLHRQIKQRWKHHRSLWLSLAEDASLRDQTVCPPQQTGVDLQSEAKGG